MDREANVHQASAAPAATSKGITSPKPLWGARQRCASLSITVLLSVGLSALSMLLAMVFAGAGHGAASPGLVLFGPVIVIVQMFPFGSTEKTSFFTIVPIVMTFYYGFYGVLLWCGRAISRGKSSLLLLLVFHYSCVVACIFSDSWDGARHLGLVSQVYSGWILVALVEWWVFLHLLAWQFATSPRPFRPQISKAALGLLVLAGLAGWLTHLLTAVPTS